MKAEARHASRTKIPCHTAATVRCVALGFAIVVVILACRSHVLDLTPDAHVSALQQGLPAVVAPSANTTAATSPRRTITIDDFHALHSPLMRTAGLHKYMTIPPKSCYGVGIATAYVSFNVSEKMIHLELACQPTQKYVTTAPSLLCVIHDPVTDTLLTTTVKGQNRYRRITCSFHVQDAHVRSLDVLPKRAFLVKTESMPVFTMLKHWNVSSVNYFESKRMLHACAFDVQAILKPHKPVLFLTGLTEVRTAADRLFDWITFHLQGGYDHIVIYDDRSQDNILEVLHPFHEVGLVTYFNWTAVAVCPSTSAARQFLAMEDFALRFGAQTEIISQFDDDFFIYVPPTNVDPSGSQPSLRESLRYVLDRFPTISEFHFIAKWFGACNDSADSGKPFIIEDSLAAYPIYEKLVWRYDKIEWTIPWVKSNRPPRLLTVISFTRSHKVVSSRMSHMWFVDGPTQYIPHQCIVYNHYKVFSWTDHQEKNKHTWIGSVANRDEHNKMNELLCKVSDSYLADQTPKLQAWAKQSLDSMRDIVHSRSWPVAPTSLPQCDKSATAYNAPPAHPPPPPPPPATAHTPTQAHAAALGSLAVQPQQQPQQSQQPQHPHSGSSESVQDSPRSPTATQDPSDVIEEFFREANAVVADVEHEHQQSLDVSPLMLAANMTQSPEFALVSIIGVDILTAFSSVRPNAVGIIDVHILQYSRSPGKRIELGKQYVCVAMLKPGSPLIQSNISMFIFRGVCSFTLDQAVVTYDDLPQRIVVLRREMFKEFVKALQGSSFSTVPDQTHMWISLTTHRVVRPSKPSMFLVGVTSVRDAANRIRNWLLYHFRLGYDHIVVYDDYCKDNTTDVLLPFVQAGLVTYVKWFMPHNKVSLFQQRQLLAMEDFAIRFSLQARFISQFDDDCYFTSPQIILKDEASTIREMLQALLVKFPGASQFLARGKWFGACNDTASSGRPFILQESLHGAPVYEKLVYRYDPVSWHVPWFKKGLASKILTPLSFTLSDKIISNIRLTHYWDIRGQNVRVNMECLAYNHYKMLPWEDHQVKNTHTWVGSQANSTEFVQINTHLCKVEDSGLADQTNAVHAWTSQSLDTIAVLVLSRSWPSSTKKFPGC